MAIDEELLSATEAAALLGVSTATLYAYVSRKKLRTQPVPGTRSHRYWRADIERLRVREPRQAGQIRPLRRSSAITLVTPEGPLYRGRSAIALAETATVEDVAALLWDVPQDQAFLPTLPRFPVEHDRLLDALQGRSGVDRALALLPLLEHANPHAFDLSASGQARTGADILRALVAILIGRPDPEPSAIHLQLARALALPAEFTDLVRRYLVIAADHGPEPSAFVVRSVAGTGVTPWRSVAAGLSVAVGRPGRVGDSAAARRFVEELVATDPERVVVERMRDDEPLPGFRSELYPDGDPRARALLDFCDAALSADRAYGALRKGLEIARDARGLSPALSLVSSFIAVRLRLLMGERARQLAPEQALFPLARAAGWIAHAREQSLAAH